MADVEPLISPQVLVALGLSRDKASRMTLRQFMDRVVESGMTVNVSSSKAAGDTGNLVVRMSGETFPTALSPTPPKEQ